MYCIICLRCKLMDEEWYDIMEKFYIGIFINSLIIIYVELIIFFYELNYLIICICIY